MESNWDLSREPGSGPLPKTVVSPIDGAEMVLVAKGPFTMGITEEEFAHISMLDERVNPVFATEIPGRIIDLESYYIDRYPVTNFQYNKFIEETGHRKPLLWKEPMWNQPMQPVVFIGWDDARAYSKWAGKSLSTEPQELLLFQHSLD